MDTPLIRKKELYGIVKTVYTASVSRNVMFLIENDYEKAFHMTMRLNDQQKQKHEIYKFCGAEYKKFRKEYFSNVTSILSPLDFVKEFQSKWKAKIINMVAEKFDDFGSKILEAELQFNYDFATGKTSFIYVDYSVNSIPVVEDNGISIIDLDNLYL